MKLRKIAILIFTAMLGVGMLTSCAQNNSNQKGEVTLTEQEKKELRKEEERLALFLVNHYEDVKKIEFLKFHKGGFGVSDSISVMVNDNNYILPVYLGGRSSNFSIGYDPNKFHLVEKNPPTQLTSLDGVEVIYYGEK